MAKRDLLNTIINKAMGNVSTAINVSQLCRVVKLSEDKKFADILPLPLTEDGRERAMLIHVPVSVNLIDYIKVDGVVVVLFMDRNHSLFDGSSNTFPIKNKRKHSVNDNVIVGVL